ncbi:MAG: hypothetical protein O7G31_09895 [Calditrichaeota bacterium]|nr:hypothetical protein [Calditrichota bacterium]
MYKKICGIPSVFIILSLLSCTSSTRSDQNSGGYYVIRKAEILAAAKKRPIQNAYELIEFLRPRYLRSRPQPSVSRGVIQSEPVVYMNNSRFGRIPELYNIDYRQIAEIKYLRSTEATQRFGMGHEGGAILISTR